VLSERSPLFAIFVLSLRSSGRNGLASSLLSESSARLASDNGHIYSVVCASWRSRPGLVSEVECPSSELELSLIIRVATGIADIPTMSCRRGFLVCSGLHGQWCRGPEVSPGSVLCPESCLLSLVVFVECTINKRFSDSDLLLWPSW